MVAILQQVAIAALIYVLVMGPPAEKVRRSEAVHEFRIPALLVTADVAALATIVYVSGTPTEMGQILVGGLLVVQLAVFYFGRGLGSYAAILGGIAYLVTTLALRLPSATPTSAHTTYSL